MEKLRGVFVSCTLYLILENTRTNNPALSIDYET